MWETSIEGQALCTVGRAHVAARLSTVEERPCVSEPWDIVLKQRRH